MLQTHIDRPVLDKGGDSDAFSLFEDEAFNKNVF